MQIPLSWLVHQIRTADGYVYAMIEKKNLQSNSMFFVDLTDSNQLFGLPQYEAKGAKGRKGGATGSYAPTVVSADSYGRSTAFLVEGVST